MIHSLKSVGLLLVITLFAIDVSAQSLFTYVTRANSGFSSQELAYVDTIAADTTTFDSVMYVQVADVWSIQDDGYFDVNLPGHSVLEADIFNFDIHDYSNQSEGYYIQGLFYGTLQDENENDIIDYDGDMMLYKDGDYYEGNFQPFDSDENYRLMSVGAGKHILLRYNANYMANAPIDDPVDTSPTAPQQVTGPCNKEIRVLVLYTDRAKNLIPFPWNVAKFTINQLNGIVVGSTYGNTQGLEFKLVSSVNIAASDFSETVGGDESDAKWDIAQFAANNQVNYLRGQFQADLVVCLVDANNTKVSGIATNTGLSTANTYALIEIDEPYSRYVMSHEIGHLMGERHQQSWVKSAGIPDNNGTYEHGYVIKKSFFPFDKYYGSIMSDGVGVTVDPFLSSPSVSFRGKTYGTSTGNDVVRHMQENACTVADYVSGPAPDFTAHISGPFLVQNGATVNLVGTPYYGYSTYDYQWYINKLDGTGWTLIAANNNRTLQDNISFTMPGLPKVLIAMHATDDVNQGYYDYKTIYNSNVTYQDKNLPTPYGDISHLKPTAVGDDHIEENMLRLFPNPSGSSVRISYSIAKAGLNCVYTITITDITGKIITEKKLDDNEGYWLVERTKLSSGVYIVSLKGGDGSISEKLIIK